MSHDEITQWICRLTDGDEAAAQGIWERYFDKLVRLAQRKLDGLPRRAADEEDVALSAMNSFFRATRAGRYPQLNDRNDLWRLLVTITSHKAISVCRRQRAWKRGGGHVQGQSVFLQSDDSTASPGIQQVMGDEPTPELACMMAETCQDLLGRLGDETLATVALRKMEGHSNSDIAQSLNVTERTVERKLAAIRRKWEREGKP